jgi:hypothetical protein
MSRNRPDDEDEPREHMQEGRRQRRPEDSPRRRNEEDDDDRPRRRRPEREDDDYSGIIPYRNGFALTGYYLSFLGLISILGSLAFIIYRVKSWVTNPPVNEAAALAEIQLVGIVGLLGWYVIGGVSALLGLIFGCIGLAKASKGKGTGHSIVAIILGSLEIIGLIFITLLGISSNAAMRR